MVPSFVPMAIFRPSVVVEHHYLRPWSPPKDEGALALLGGGIKTRTAVQATIKYWYETGCVYKFDRGARQTSGLSSNDHIENPISCPPRTAGSGKGCRPPLPTAGSLCPPPAAGRGSDRPPAAGMYLCRSLCPCLCPLLLPPLLLPACPAFPCPPPLSPSYRPSPLPPCSACPPRPPAPPPHPASPLLPAPASPPCPPELQLHKNRRPDDTTWRPDSASWGQRGKISHRGGGLADATVLSIRPTRAPPSPPPSPHTHTRSI